MFKLNIPLSSTSSGTRQSTRSRRVLRLGLFWLVVVIFSIILAEVWFSRDTLSSYAPEGTKTIIHLTPSRLAWTKIASDFKDAPLISGRPLSFNDVFLFEPAELAIFISEANESSIAVRANDKNLPFNLLNSYNITAQKLGRNKWLFSSKPLPFATKGTTSWHLSSATPGNIGFFSSNGFVGQIKQTSRGYQISVPKTGFKNKYLPNLPETTMVAISIQDDQPLSLESVSDQFGLLINPLEVFKTTEFLRKVTEDDAVVVFTKPEESSETVDFLIKTGITGTDLSQATQLIAAFQNPELNYLSLPDGSKTQEIVVSPQNVEFQTLWINGLESKAVNTPTGQILALETQNNGFISSSNQLLQEFIQNQDKKTRSSCGSDKKLGYLTPKMIGNTMQDKESSVPKPNLIKYLAIFEEMTLADGKIDFCY